ncbi:MAG: protoglobin domain-containing protein, partial [Chloroherpetonaceae bacterium]|nr:globin-coupled sensor protein [Chthonomonadaceae bacterium]MDW8206229.1 protoglobin domain-containing protein [Chloroherpetonaceae bacterium]
MQSLTARYGISDSTLQSRQQFIGLQPEHIRALARLHPWAQRTAPRIARELYDHQFHFPNTLQFFQKQTQRLNLSLDALRQVLEQKQAEYLVQIFEEARNGGRFGTDYFERRLRVGQVHNQIDLPLKWYLGTYALYLRLCRKHLWRSQWLRPRLCQLGMEALETVFNYDMQAVTDAFVLDMMESAGFDLRGVVVEAGRDLSDYVGQIKLSFAQETQKIADALANGDLTVQITPTSEKDMIRKGLKQCVDQVRQLVERLQVSGRELQGSASQIAEIIQGVSGAMNQSATTSQEMARGSEQQAQAATEAAQAMEHLRTAVTRVQQGTQQQQQA